MKDIGSIFPLCADDMSSIDKKSHGETSQENRINFSLCREAIYSVAEIYKYTRKIVLIPAYTCQTVIDPFVQQGWKCFFYNITENLRIDAQDLLQKYRSIQPTLIVVHPFHGMELNNSELDTLKAIKEDGCVLMEDITQCIYSNIRPSIFDYFTGSYRKWFKVPDGGFVETKELDNIIVPLSENCDFVSKQVDAMYLRGLYFKTGDEIVKAISIKLNKEAVMSISHTIECHKMSDLSINIMDNEDINTSIEIRFKNYKRLYDRISQTLDLKFACRSIDEVTTAPLYFPIYLNNRTEIQKKLALQHIYAPVLWPVQTEDVLINDNIRYIYSHILMLPIDQRYNETDMDRIVSVLNN